MAVLPGSVPRWTVRPLVHRSPLSRPGSEEAGALGPAPTGHGWSLLDPGRWRGLAPGAEQASRERDLSCLPTKKGKVCVASEFPEKCSQHSAQLCGLAPSVVPWEGALCWLSRRCRRKEPGAPSWEMLTSEAFLPRPLYFFIPLQKPHLILTVSAYREVAKTHKEFPCTFRPDSRVNALPPLPVVSLALSARVCVGGCGSSAVQRTWQIQCPLIPKAFSVVSHSLGHSPSSRLKIHIRKLTLMGEPELSHRLDSHVTSCLCHSLFGEAGIPSPALLWAVLFSLHLS